ncbi:MAG TPA: AMP-binding protein [Pseudonocardia sp.]|jgi:fatty-acyl-CoA synthase
MQVLDFGGYLERAARLYRTRPAVIAEGDRLTWSQLHQRADQLAVGLTDLGLRPGDRVADLRANGVDSMVVEFALALAGLVRVPLNPRFTPDEVARLVAGVDARAMLTAAGFEQHITAVSAESSSVRFIVGHGVSGAIEATEIVRARTEKRPVIDPDALINIRFTGGTTGLPKAVMARQATQIGWSAMLLMDLLDIDQHDVLLQTQPYSHGGGNTVLPCAMRGAALLLQERFDADAVLDAVEAEQATMVKIVPTVLYRLLEAQRRRPRDLSSLRLLIYGAAPMPEQLIHEAFDLFDCGFAQVYGQAEAQTTIACLTERDHERERRTPTGRIRSVGRPYSMTDVAVLDPQGRTLAPGEHGEIVVRGVLTADGYWNDPEMTAEVFRDGWVHTGDLGYLDADGYLFLVGRAGDVMISGGFNVYPAEVEQALTAVPGVAAAVVTSLPDLEWGDRVVAAVVPADGVHLDPDQVRGACREKIAGFKCPKEIRVVDEIPLNPNGKVNRARARALFARTGAGGENR